MKLVWALMANSENPLVEYDTVFEHKFAPIIKTPISEVKKYLLSVLNITLENIFANSLCDLPCNSIYEIPDSLPRSAAVVGGIKSMDTVGGRPFLLSDNIKLKNKFYIIYPLISNEGMYLISPMTYWIDVDEKFDYQGNVESVTWTVKVKNNVKEWVGNNLIEVYHRPT